MPTKQNLKIDNIGYRFYNFANDKTIGESKMQYNEQLAQYGILAKNTKAYEMRQGKIILSNIEIEEIDLKTLEEQKIKELVIENSKINNLLFAQINNIKLNFECCTFKNQIISKGLSFEKSICFVFCVFQEEVGFLDTIFTSSVSFNNSRFKGDVKFIKTTFCNDNYSNQDDFQQIANNFRETYFERQCYFDNITFKSSVSFSIARFQGDTRFTNIKFLSNQQNSEMIQNDFGEAYFERQCYFDNITFKSSVSFSIARFQGDARFTNIKFLSNQQNSKIIQNNFEEAYFNGNVLFASWNLCLKVNFILSRFNNEALFMDMLPDSFIFNNTSFNKAKFIYSNDYQNAIKQKYSDDNRCNSLVFQNSIFQDTLTFESAINIDIKFKFDNVVFKGIVTFNEANFSNKPSFTNCTFSNQFNIKHKHIQYSYEEIKKTQDYNQLLNYRDLFRKLKSNRIAHHNLIDASELHSQELYTRELELDSKETKTLKEKVEKWQLWFYRKLCDHHTDILKSFHSLMLVIGLFGLMGLVVIIGFEYCLGYESIFSHLYMIKEIYDAHIQTFIKTHTLCTIAFNFFILAFYFGILVYLISAKRPRRLFIGISYVVVIGILLISPKILIPAMGIFTDKRELLDPLSTLGGIYTIIFGFVLFSFIKTIRKNSIVPN